MTDGPQLANGYIRIANELFDAILQAGFSKRELCVMLAVVRQTYGYAKKTDDCTVSRLAKIAGINRQGCSETLKSLVDRRCVLKRDGRHGYIIELNKHYAKWRPSQNGTPRPKTGHVPKQDTPRPETGRATVPKRDTQKTTLQKTTPKGGTRARTRTRATGRKPMRPDPVPENLNLELWDRWIAFRQGQKKWPTLSQDTINRQAAELATLDAAQQKAIVEYSLDSYRTLYFDRANRNGAGKPNLQDGKSRNYEMPMSTPAWAEDQS